MHDQTGRLFLCARCHCQVLVCSPCDHGQRYCASGCADITRQCRQREAGKRYQQGRAGCHKHAARSRKWRRRRAALAKIVTHQGSQAGPADAQLQASESPPALPPDSQASSQCKASISESIVVSATARTGNVALAVVWRCHWCQSPCAALVRIGFLRHSRWVRNVHDP